MSRLRHLYEAAITNPDVPLDILHQDVEVLVDRLSPVNDGDNVDLDRRSPVSEEDPFNVSLMQGGLEGTTPNLPFPCASVCSWFLRIIPSCESDSGMIAAVCRHSEHHRIFGGCHH